MDSAKSEPKKNDAEALTKIPPVSRSSSTSKPMFIKANRYITPSLSKIPKRDVCSFSITKKAALPPNKPISRRTFKPLECKNSSKSMLSLGVLKTPRPHALTSSRSNINTQRSFKSKEQTPRSQISDRSCGKFQKPSDRVAAKKNILAFEIMEEKVRTCQTEFMRKWEVVKDDLPADAGEYKLISLVKNNDGQLVTKTAQKVKVKCVPKSLDEFKKDMHNYVDNNLNIILDSLDELKNTSGKIGDNSVRSYESLTAIEDCKKKIKADNLNALGDILKKIECFEPTEKHSDTPTNAELEVKVTKLLQEVDELRKNLEQSQKELTRIKKSDEDKGSSYKRDLSEKDKKLAKKQMEVDELKKKLELLEKDTTKDKTHHKELQEKLNNKTVEVEDLKKELKKCMQTNNAQEIKNQEHETSIKKLAADLNSALKDVEKRTSVEHSIGDQATKYADEIKVLKGDISNFKKEKEKLEMEVQRLKKESEKQNDMGTQLTILKDKIKYTDVENQNLRQTIKDLEKKLQASESQSYISRDTQDELTKLLRIDNENKQKIESLEKELTKAHFQNQKLEEKIVMDRKLLKVRCSIIESLQTKEHTQKTHLEDLLAEVGERNNDIQMLKTELLTKTEEFQNVFSTLSTKQLELTRQEHMIKLLQESNERAQTLRVRQEAKIGRLEEEVLQLKQTISLYQDAVLPNNALRKNLLMAEANRDGDLNDNLGYYIDERRRKRHIDINVKKYEK